MTERSESIAARLNELLAKARLPLLEADDSDRFVRYYSLLVHWNSRLNLTAVRDSDAILSRHFVESIACARALPEGIATLLDFGSGGGFPGVPIAICRPEIHVTLAESQNKKAAFLNEAVRVLEINARVFAARAETLAATFDSVTLRAVDRMDSAIERASHLIVPGGWCVVMTTDASLEAMQRSSGAIEWEKVVPLPGGTDRVIAFSQNKSKIVPRGTIADFDTR